MLYVELLFQHVRPDQHCCQLDNVYEASQYAVSGSAHKKGRLDLSGDLSADSSSGEEDYGDEFDETQLSAAFERSAKDSQRRTEEKKKARRPERAPRDKSAKKARRSDWSAEEDDELRAQYVVYAGSASIFATIANSAELM